MTQAHSIYMKRTRQRTSQSKIDTVHVDNWCNNGFT